MKQNKLTKAGRKVRGEFIQAMLRDGWGEERIKEILSERGTLSAINSICEHVSEWGKK